MPGGKFGHGPFRQVDHADADTRMTLHEHFRRRQTDAARSAGHHNASVHQTPSIHIRCRSLRFKNDAAPVDNRITADMNYCQINIRSSLYDNFWLYMHRMVMKEPGIDSVTLNSVQRQQGARAKPRAADT